MRIAIVSDAWHPQVNGVVRTLMSVSGELLRRGHTVAFVTPEQFRSIPAPSYPEIRLAMPAPGAVARRIDEARADAIHIATEGPLGWIARRYCQTRGLPFTTAYHTQFPEYLARRTGLPARHFWPLIRRFHAPATRVLVATRSIEGSLRRHGFTRLHRWSRGVDTATFHPDIMPPDLFFALPRPIQLYVGRVAVEKNIEAFLANPHPGAKVVVGDGPALASLQTRFPDAVFLGRKTGAELAACYAGADVFAFPSRTDTFGLVMLEALACGTPVAAFPVEGPIDVLSHTSGAMSENLATAIAAALRLNRADCLAHGRSFSWSASAEQFLAGLEPIRGETADAA